MKLFTGILILSILLLYFHGVQSWFTSSGGSSWGGRRSNVIRRTYVPRRTYVSRRTYVPRRISRTRTTARTRSRWWGRRTTRPQRTQRRGSWWRRSKRRTTTTPKKSQRRGSWWRRRKRRTTSRTTPKKSQRRGSWWRRTRRNGAGNTRLCVSGRELGGLDRDKRQSCDISKGADKKMFKHIHNREGTKKSGYFPTKRSGVTVATGIDLGQQSEKGLRRLGVPDSVIKKFKPYLGLKSQAAVHNKGLRASGLKLTSTEVATVDNAFYKHLRKRMDPYSKSMSTRGKAVLMSLGHYAGSLSRSSKVGGRNNALWKAIKGKAATDQDLVKALKTTRRLHRKGSVPYNRIGHEIQYLQNGAG